MIDINEFYDDPDRSNDLTASHESGMQSVSSYVEKTLNASVDECRSPDSGRARRRRFPGCQERPEQEPPSPV